ncbi:MAG: hypothetical protein OEW52_00140 [Thermoleophilia bacterium]|nr:hypothetical protein [Thermoleophilia bacterium]
MTTAAPLSAQSRLDSLVAAADTLGTEVVRSRAFIRAADTQLSKVVRLQNRIDSLVARMNNLPVPPPTDTVAPPPPVEPPPPPPPTGGNVVLAADWDTGELTDGGRFVDWAANGGSFEVRNTATDGKSFSTPRYLRVNASGGGWVDMISGTWPAPQVGQTVTASWEIMWRTSVSGQTTHGFYFDDNFGGTNWGPQTLGLEINDSGDRWEIGVWTGIGTTPDSGPHKHPTRYNLLKSQAYRVALSYTRTGASAFTVGFEVRNMDGSLVYDESVMDDDWFPGSQILGTRTFTKTDAGAQGMRGFRLGNNGLDVPFTGVIVEVANLRVTVE